MSFENEGLPVSWDEIKKASRRLDWGGNEKVAVDAKRVVRKYLSKTGEQEQDVRSVERQAVPGYN